MGITVEKEIEEEKFNKQAMTKKKAEEREKQRIMKQFETLAASDGDMTPQGKKQAKAMAAGSTDVSAAESREMTAKEAKKKKKKIKMKSLRAKMRLKSK